MPMEATKEKRVYGLLGSNISYSLSPCMHNSAFGHFGINAEYVIFDVKPSHLREFVEGVNAREISGLNITVPYKADVMEIMLESGSNLVEEGARKIGAVNTIRSDPGRLEGFNTDGPGFAESLKDDLELSLEKLSGKNVLLLGAGGAGRAVSFYLLSRDLKPGKIFVYDIDNDKKQALLNDLISCFGDSYAVTAGDDDLIMRASECDLVVNATPLGTKEGDPLPLPGGCPGGRAALYDLVYARETEMISSWKKKGLPASGGLGMLVNQAALSFMIWTREEYDLCEIKSVMRSSLPATIKEQYGWNIS
ncbi:MAG: shikimate dehydrogenase [Candidatus Omnitrophota bacterium]